MPKASKMPPAVNVDCRAPALADAASIYALVKSCEPLDLNSEYSYLLLTAHFSETCLVAEIDTKISGFVSSYRKPTDHSVLFVWQVAVSAEARGQGLGLRMLNALLSRAQLHDIRSIETTIMPSNKASWALFESFARRRNAACFHEPLFQAEHFGGNTHEEERLLRIDLFPSKQKD